MAKGYKTNSPGMKGARGKSAPNISVERRHASGVGQGSGGAKKIRVSLVGKGGKGGLAPN